MLDMSAIVMTVSKKLLNYTHSLLYHTYISYIWLPTMYNIVIIAFLQFLIG